MAGERLEQLDLVRALVRVAESRILATGWDADLLLVGQLQRMESMLVSAGARLEQLEWDAAQSHEGEPVQMLRDAAEVMDMLDPAGVPPEVLIVRGMLAQAVMAASAA